MWQWAAGTQASHCIFLQDDARVSPSFWSELTAMVQAQPEAVIGLEVVHHAATALAAEGHRWFTTADCLVGVGYVVPRAKLTAFLSWRASELLDGWRTPGPNGQPALTEDTLIAVWCLVTGERIWHPLPTIIDHDTEIASTYANDGHPNRRPLVRWDTDARAPVLAAAAAWRTDVAPPHVGRFYEATPHLARRWVRGVTEEDVQRWQRDNGRNLIRSLGYAQRARALRANGDPPPRVFVATPTREGHHPEHTTTLLRLQGAEFADLMVPVEVDYVAQERMDLVRARSRLVTSFLDSDASHLFFVDADVSFGPELLFHMLAAGKEVVAAPYPRRGQVNFAAVARAGGEVLAAGDPPDAPAWNYPVVYLPDADRRVDEQQCVEVERIALGCALIQRSAIERMVAFYRERLVAERRLLRQHAERMEDRELAGAIRRVLGYLDEEADPSLTFADEQTSRQHVALFLLPIRRGHMLGEDYAFCERWRRLGGKVHMYLGPGSPVNHHGSITHRGRLESFGLRRRLA